MSSGLIFDAAYFISEDEIEWFKNWIINLTNVFLYFFFRAVGSLSANRFFLKKKVKKM